MVITQLLNCPRTVSDVPRNARLPYRVRAKHDIHTVPKGHCDSTWRVYRRLSKFTRNLNVLHSTSYVKTIAVVSWTQHCINQCAIVQTMNLPSTLGRSYRTMTDLRITAQTCCCPIRIVDSPNIPLALDAAVVKHIYALGQRNVSLLSLILTDRPPPCRSSPAFH